MYTSSINKCKRIMAIGASLTYAYEYHIKIIKLRNEHNVI